MAAGKNAMGIGEKQVFFFLSPPLATKSHPKKTSLFRFNIDSLSFRLSLNTFLYFFSSSSFFFFSFFTGCINRIQ